MHRIHTDASTPGHVFAMLKRNGPLNLFVAHCTGAQSLVGLAAAQRGQASQCLTGTIRGPQRSRSLGTELPAWNGLASSRDAVQMLSLTFRGRQKRQ